MKRKTWLSIILLLVSILSVSHALINYRVESVQGLNNVNPPPHRITSFVLDSFTWQEGSFNHTFDFSSLKPSGYYSEQVLRVTINYQCFGVKASSGITYFLLMGGTTLKRGTISYIEQMNVNGSLIIETFTFAYHDTLSFNILGSSNGVGGLTIFNSSTIEIAPINTITEQPLSRLIADERSVDGPTTAVSFSFYDVFRTTLYDSKIMLAVNFNTFSSYEHPFSLLALMVKIDDVNVISRNINELGFANISEVFSLESGYHEIRITFQFAGINTPLTLEQLKYQIALQIEDETISPSSPSLVLTPAHQFSFYLLAFYALLYVILDIKELNRKRIEDEENTNQEDAIPNPSDGSKDLLRTILVVIVFPSITLLPSVGLRLCGVDNWFIFPLSFLVALHFSIKILFSNLTKHTLIGFWSKTKEFFADIYSISGFLNKITQSFRKLSFRSLTRILVFAVAFLSFGLLFFLADNIPSTAGKEVWIVYALFSFCILSSSLSLFYSLHLARNMAFVEDNLKRIMKLGYVSIILVAGFLFILISMLSIRISLSSIWGFLSPAFLFGTFKTTTKLGKIAAREEKLSYDDFLDKGMLFTDKQEMRKAVSFGITTRSTWEKKGHALQKHQIIGVITYDHNLGDRINVYELAEKIKLPFKKTEELVLEIEKEVPRLGTYDSQTKIYTKSNENTIEPQELHEKIVPDKYEDKEKNVEMNKESKENTSAKEKFQQLYDEIAGECEEEKKATLEYVHHLTTKEAEVYLKFLKRGLKESELSLIDVDLEFLQKAIKKLNPEDDVLQRNHPSNLLKDIYDDLEDRKHGFDDVILARAQNMFNLVFVECKGGDYVALHPWDYIPKKSYNERRLCLNEKQLHTFVNEGGLRNAPIKSKVKKLKGSNVPQFVFKLYYDRNRQYHSIGNDWLTKFRNGDFVKAMKKLVEKKVLSEQKKKRMINGLLEQNKLIALAQNGHIVSKSKKTAYDLLETTDINYDGEKIRFTNNFFMPIFKKKGKHFVFSLIGFSGKLSNNQIIIQELIPEVELKKKHSDNELLILYAGIKRQFLMNLFNKRKLDNLADFEDGRAKYALETLVSRNLTDRIYDWFDNFIKRRGISWFYDYANHSFLDFIHPNELVKMFQRGNERNLFSELTDLLVDSEYIFDSDNSYNSSRDIFQKNPFIFQLNNKGNKLLQYPPKFNYWDHGKPPSIGIVLVSDDNKLLLHKPETGGLSSAKVLGIQLLDEEILLNFPYRWDNSAGGYIFGRHSKDTSKFTVIGEAWSNWLKKNQLMLPAGPSAKIPEESVIVMLLEWRRRISNFVNERIIRSGDFNSFCKKENITVEEREFSGLFTREGISYQLAKVSMDKGGRLRHLDKWKYFDDPQENVIRLLEVLKALIFDITLREREVKSESIANISSWLEENWLDEFSSIKHYFY